MCVLDRVDAIVVHVVAFKQC